MRAYPPPPYLRPSTATLPPPIHCHPTSAHPLPPYLPYLGRRHQYHVRGHILHVSILLTPAHSLPTVDRDRLSRKGGGEGVRTKAPMRTTFSPRMMYRPKGKSQYLNPTMTRSTAPSITTFAAKRAARSAERSTLAAHRKARQQVYECRLQLAEIFLTKLIERAENTNELSAVAKNDQQSLCVTTQTSVKLQPIALLTG